MKWYQYVACFFAGMFFVNSIPHFIHGMEGDAFPTPFADLPGTGLSSSLVNVLWALANVLAGGLLLRVAGMVNANKRSLLMIFAGIAACSILLSIMAPMVLDVYKQSH